MGVRAEFYNSSLPHSQRDDILQRLEREEIDLLYVAPEGLFKERFLSSLKKSKVCLFAIDEAHCVSQWGHDFRPEYLKLAEITTEFPGVPKIALTATADKKTRQEIVAKLKLENHASFVASFDRPNITYSVEIKAQPAAQLLKYIKLNHLGDAGIVYCLSRAKVEKTAKLLEEQGFNALPYHAGLSFAKREDNQRRFINEENIIIVATIAFGLGINKPNVRFVAHLDMPSSMEAYYQETGRAGRDGLPASAWMVYGLQDVVLRRKMIFDTDGAAAHKQVSSAKLNDMLAFCETTSCRRRVILHYFGEAYDAACGNCDTCLQPVDTIDGTVLAQKFLSCIYRSGQKFGAGQIIDILRGQETEKVQRNRHRELSTFGIGTDLSEFEWKSVFRQLYVQGSVEVVENPGYSTLALNKESYAILKGEKEFRIRKEVRTRQQIKKPLQTARKQPESELSAAQLLLFNNLKEWRLEKAREKGMPAYCISDDKSLRSLVVNMPRSLDKMHEVFGWGEKKIGLYGEELLAILKAIGNDSSEDSQWALNA
jgi:ATP-dependent DNA helicase RecQ